MTRYYLMAVLTALLALVLGACESNTDDTNTQDDTGVPAETITVTIETSIDGSVVDDQPVSIEDTAEILAEGLTGNPIEIKLRSSAQVWIGDVTEDLTSDGHRIHEVNGTEYIHRDVSVNTDTGPDPLEVPLNVYSYIPDCTCHLVGYDGWEYDYNEGEIETTDGFMLGLHASLGDGSWLEVNGSELVLAGQKADNGMFVASYSITNDTISFVIESDYGGLVDTFTCR